MIYKKGFKFKPTFTSNIEFFEFDHFDEATNLVHTLVYPTVGLPFNDCIEKPYYEGAFVRGDYVAIR